MDALFGNPLKSIENEIRLEVNNTTEIKITESILSKHMICLGTIGSGKTNAIYQLVDSVKKNMNTNDVMIVFDSKGDFCQEFFCQETDIIISNDDRSTSFWNMFLEVINNSNENVDDNIRELSNMLFSMRIEKSSQPFFPNAAKDVFAGILIFLIRKLEISKLDNESIIDFLNYYSGSYFCRFFAQYDDLKWLNEYLTTEEIFEEKTVTLSEQGLGVISELRMVCNEILFGNFNKIGDFSIRNFVREKGGKSVFIEYDVASAKILTPIYKTMYDLAIKESLANSNHDGSVYFIIDELMLLPNLQYLENGINFGRSLGAKFIVSLQNVNQIFSIYNTYLSKSLLSGFGTVISFRVNDFETRKYLKERFGKIVKRFTYRAQKYSDGNKEIVSDRDVIEDWELSSLKVGEAIISIGEDAPVKVKFEKY